MLAFWKRAYLRKKLGPPVVIVSGLPRSGTSMMMKMLTAAGQEIVTDEIRSADEDNPKGYFEFERVKELDKSADKGWVREHRGKVLKVISFLLQDLPDDCFYRVIFMRRELPEVIASQNKMLDRRGESGGEAGDQKMMQLYRGHLVKVGRLLKERHNFELLDVNYRQVVDEPRVQAARVVEFLDLNVDANQVASAVDRSLYRNRQPS